MIWHRLSLVFAALPMSPGRAVAQVARRWTQAARVQPVLRNDLIRLGGVLTAQPNGPTPMDLHRLAYLAGRRDLALQLLALMGLDTADMNTLMELNDE